MAINPGDARKGALLSLVVKDTAQLLEIYMPFLKRCGIFVPTAKRYFLGDEVFLFLTLPGSTERLPIAGRVVWVTSPGAQDNRVAGIGLEFPDGDAGGVIRNKVEDLLVGMLNSDKHTLTM